MAKRMQGIFEDLEYREIETAARSRHMSLAEWVREALQMARRQEPIGTAGKKLDAIRAARQQEFPIAEIEGMLQEIEAGYGRGEIS